MRFLVVVLSFLPVLVFAQDVIIKRDGKEIKSRLVKIDKKTISYKDVNDPEFNTVVVDKKDVRMIKMEDGRLIDYDRVYPKPYLGLGAGLFLSTARFASTELNNDKGFTPSFAKGGLNLNLRAGFYFSKHWGIPIEFQYNTANFDGDSYATQMTGGTTSVDFETNFQPYKISVLRTGLMYSGNIGRKVTFDIKALIGPMRLAKFELTDIYSDPITTQVLLEKRTVFKSATSFAGGAGFHFRYAIAPKFSAGVFYDFLAANPIVKYDRFISTSGAPVSQTSTETNLELTRSVSGVVVGMTLYWEFNRLKGN